MKEKVLRFLFSILSIFIVAATCSVAISQHEQMHDDMPLPDGATIGKINFEVDCNQDVRAHFDRSLGMLHHMMYVIARDSFEQIAEADPNCAMAYWGISTTLFQPIWGTRPSDEDLQYGWDTISKAMELVEADREQILIESTAGFFREPESADFRTRIDRWVSGVKKAYEAYQDDADIASLYALTKMTQAQFSDNRGPLYDDAENILWKVFEQNPEHPGAIHYMIHTTDVDGRAENALEVVKAYASIAPQVPHALHMPSHIYVRLGDWPQVIDWNRQSASAALNHPLNGAESHHYIHAIDYLVYAYLQRGEDEKAENIYLNALTKDRHQQSFISAFHFAAIPARLAVEQRDWERALNLEPRTPDYLPWDASPWAEGLTWYAKGLGAVHSGDLQSAREAERRMGELRDVAEQRGDDNMVAYIETERLVLAGRIAFEVGDEEKAIRLIRSAAELEAHVEKHPVTPGTLQPPREALGNLFIDLNRPAEALTAYEESDQMWPGRLNTLMGAVLAAHMIGYDDTAREHFARLLERAGTQDIDLLDEVHETDH